MTEKQIIELGRRAVACNGWRWLPGMLTLGKSLCVDGGGPFFTDRARPRGQFQLAGGFGLPDMRDPCTRGGLLELVRVATGEQTAFVRYDGVRDGYIVATGIGDRVLGPYAETEAEALVRALEVAP